MDRNVVRIIIGLALLVPGAVLWLGPVVLEFGLIAFLPILVALMVIGGVMLTTTGISDLRRSRRGNNDGF